MIIILLLILILGFRGLRQVFEWFVTFIALSIMIVLFGAPFFYLVVIFLVICGVAGIIAGIIEALIN